MSHSFSQTVVLSALIVSVAQLSVRAEVEKHVRLLHISDTHAQLETHPEYMPGEKPELHMMGGYARLKTAIDVERKGATGAVFLVDGGDTFQGSGAAAWSRGQVVVNPLNALGLDAFVPGNWEPVYGAARPRAWRRKKRRNNSALFSSGAAQDGISPPAPTWDNEQ